MSATPRRGYSRSIFLFALGIISLALTLAMDFFFGKSLGLTDDMQKLMGLVFASIDVIVVGLAFVNGSLFRDGHRILATCLTLFITFGAVLAMTATIGFSGAQRLGKSEAAIVAFNNANAAAEAHNSYLKEQHERTVEWAKNTLVTGATRSIRQQAADALKALANTPVELKPVDQAMVSPDIQAEALVKALNTFNVPTKIDTVQMALTIALAVFFNLAPSVCFGLGSYLWQSPIRKMVEADVEDFRSFRHDEEESESHEPRISNNHRLPETEDDLALAAALKPDVEELQKMRNVVARFLDECTYSDPDSRVRSSDFYDAYVSWAQRNNEEEFSHNMFGRICTSLRVARDSAERRRAWYVGLGLRTGGEEAALAIAA